MRHSMTRQPRYLLPLFALISALACTTHSLAASDEPDGFSARERPSIGIDNWSVAGKMIDRSYDVSVALPIAYAQAPDRRFPAIVVVDGNRMFGMAVDMVRGLAGAGEAQDLFVIAIGTPFEEGQDAWVRRRVHEFSIDNEWPMTDAFGAIILKLCEGRYKLTASECVGGGPRFLTLIREEILSPLLNHYRIDREALGLFGVSAGGFFASWALLQDDSPFVNYIISSPAMAYGDSEIFRLEKAFADSHDDLRAGVYMAGGTLEVDAPYYEGVGRIISGMAAFGAALAGRQYPGLRLSTGMHQGLGHSDAAAATLAIGLRTLYPPQSSQ